MDQSPAEDAAPAGHRTDVRGRAARAVLGACLASSSLLAGCADEPSPESQVREVIARAEKAAEARDLGGVMDLVADSYADGRGQDRERVRELMRGYFVLNQSIHLLTAVDSVEFPSDEVATAQVTVGMLGRQGEEDWSLAADVYEFDIRLRRVDDEWLLQSADYRRASAP